MRQICEGIKLSYADFLLRCGLLGIRTELLQFDFIDATSASTLAVVRASNGIIPHPPHQPRQRIPSGVVDVSCASSSDCVVCDKVPVKPLCAYCRLPIKGGCFFLFQLLPQNDSPLPSPTLALGRTRLAAPPPRLARRRSELTLGLAATCAQCSHRTHSKCYRAHFAGTTNLTCPACLCHCALDGGLTSNKISLPSSSSRAGATVEMGSNYADDLGLLPYQQPVSVSGTTASSVMGGGIGGGIGSGRMTYASLMSIQEQDAHNSSQSQNSSGVSSALGLHSTSTSHSAAASVSGAEETEAEGGGGWLGWEGRLNWQPFQERGQSQSQSQQGNNGSQGGQGGREGQKGQKDGAGESQGARARLGGSLKRDEKRRGRGKR